MKKVGLLVLVMFGFAQVSSAAEAYSKMSANELNAAFITAVKKRCSDEVQKLVQAGADVNIPISYWWTEGDCDWEIESTALIYAIRHNCPKMVKALLLKVEKKKLNEALDIAIKEGYPDVVEELIKGGANINYVNENKDTPLIRAVQYAHATSEFNPQAQERFKYGWARRRKIIQTLLKEGANVSHANKDGRTALMEAVIEHDLNTVQSLLQVPEMTRCSYFGFGTEPINYADKDGNTALILAIKNVRDSYINSQEYQICLNSQNIVKALLETPGINVHHVNKNGDTAIELLKKINSRV
jgi:ankyrin repeat protein